MFVCLFVCLVLFGFFFTSRAYDNSARPTIQQNPNLGATAGGTNALKNSASNTQTANLNNKPANNTQQNNYNQQQPAQVAQVDVCF
jgi:hypothetical protein